MLSVAPKKLSSKHSLSTLLLLLLITLLYLWGALMVFNTSSAEVIDIGKGGDPLLFFKRHLLYGFCGAIFGYWGYRSAFSFLMRHISVVYGLGLFSLLLVFIPPFGKAANGSHRWLNLFGWSLQPSEFMKYLLALFAIALSSDRYHPTFLRREDRWKKLLLLLAPLVLVALEPNYGSALTMAAVLLVLLFFTSRSLFPLCVALVTLSFLFISAASTSAYVRNRIWVHLHPEGDLLGRGHQPYQSKLTIGSGGLFGRGIGQSRQKQGFLPEAQNDYIAAIVAEEQGYIGILVLLFLYLSLTLLLFLRAFLSPRREESLFCAITAFLISFQAALNLAVVSTLLPSTGLNLPLFSQGGSSLLAHSIALGIVCRLPQESSFARKEELKIAR